MAKKIFALIIIIALAAGAFFLIKNNYKNGDGCLVLKGYGWCKYQNKCIKKTDGCNLTADWVLSEAKKTTGMDLNIMPNQVLECNVEGKKNAFSCSSFVYTAELDSKIIADSYGKIEALLKQNAFQTNDENPAVDSEKEKSIFYFKEKIACQIKKVRNSESSSSLYFSCGNTDVLFCYFNSSCGRQCQADSDCALIVNGCEKKSVCRNKNFKFFNDCLNPTADVGDIDTYIVECSCIENQCVPKNEKYRDRN